MTKNKDLLNVKKSKFLMKILKGNGNIVMKDITKKTICNTGKTKHFINLTNGISALNTFTSVKDWHFIRILSTHCESKQWGKILQYLDNDFLLYLSLGYNCYVYDYSHHGKMSRACYQGIEWVRYALNKNWFKKEIRVNMNGTNCKEYFRKEYKKLDRPTINKLKYFKKFLNTKKIRIQIISGHTSHDGDYSYFREILIKNLNK
jgi:hypothetical protein